MLQCPGNSKVFADIVLQWMEIVWLVQQGKQSIRLTEFDDFAVHEAGDSGKESVILSSGQEGHTVFINRFAVVLDLRSQHLALNVHCGNKARRCDRRICS